MALSTGTRLGPYEITALVGAGGMGEVYRATDTSLGRQVAIKVLPDAVAADAERVARFEREARTLAALNHPNIAAIYGLEKANAGTALVMEFVDGPTLAECLAGGPMPIHDALPIARQIADALEAAHEQGIIHRDLKPANIKRRPDGTVKVLDFGLAKALDPASAASSSISLSPTITSPAPMTGLGVLLGTAAYMAPEQARGKPADRRVDIWAFGAVLYELLTGKRAFAGDEITDTLAFIITKDPDWTALPANTPPALQKLLRRCLEKDRKRRLADIADARLEIDEATSAPIEGAAAPAIPLDPTSARSTFLRRVAPIVAAAFLLATLVLAAIVFVLLRRDPPAAVTRFTVAPPDKTTLHIPGTGIASSNGFNGGTISPDGRMLALTLVDAAGTLKLWLRHVDALAVQPLPGTENATLPFWSPDSRSIAFFADGQLKRVDLAGGPPLALCPVDAQMRGGSWSRQGVILFAPVNGPLRRVAAAGGEASPASKLQKGESAHRRPFFLPDGRHFLHHVTGTTPNIVVGSLDSDETVPLLHADSQAVYVPPGLLLFVRQGTLLAQSFDAGSLRLTGEPSPIAEHVATDTTGGLAAFSASSTGILTFRTGSVLNNPGGGTGIQLDWVDRTGKQMETAGSLGSIRGVELSPDGAEVALHRHETEGGDLWLLNLARGTTTRLTFDPSRDNNSPVWSPDGRRVAFASRRGSDWGLYQKQVVAAGNDDELLLQTEVAPLPTSWSPDNRLLVYTAVDVKTGPDIWLLPLTGDRKPVPFARDAFSESFGRVSPDGRWIAYQSNETGRFEVYVRPFPSGPGKWLISTQSGIQPRWRRDGAEIVYFSGTTGAQGRFTSTEVKVDGATFRFGAPKLLFGGFLNANPAANGGIPFAAFIVANDGQRLLIARQPSPEDLNDRSSGSITVVVNWQEELKRRTAQR